MRFSEVTSQAVEVQAKKRGRQHGNTATQRRLHDEVRWWRERRAPCRCVVQRPCGHRSSSYLASEWSSFEWCVVVCAELSLLFFSLSSLPLACWLSLVVVWCCAVVWCLT